MSEEKIEDGGPCFPVTERQEYADGQIVCHEWAGISKREFFAGMAIVGMAGQLPEHHQKITSNAYLLADAMIAAGKK